MTEIFLELMTGHDAEPGKGARRIALVQIKAMEYCHIVGDSLFMQAIHSPLLHIEHPLSVIERTFKAAGKITDDSRQSREYVKFRSHNIFKKDLDTLVPIGSISTIISYGGQKDDCEIYTLGGHSTEICHDAESINVYSSFESLRNKLLVGGAIVVVPPQRPQLKPKVMRHEIKAKHG